jgi:hypothetical protein
VLPSAHPAGSDDGSHDRQQGGRKDSSALLAWAADRVTDPILDHVSAAGRRPGTAIAIAGAAAIGASLVAVVFQPGVMSPDSIDFYSQAISGTFAGDWHAPLLGFVWGLIIKLIPGPLGLLLWHQLLFWGGLALIVLACRFGPLLSAAAVLAVGLMPPVFALLGILWTDVGMAAGLTLAVGLILYGRRRRSPMIIGIALLPLLYALGMRLNAAPALIPLTVWLVAELMRARRLEAIRAHRLALTSIALFATLLGLNLAINRLIVNSPGPHVPGTAPLQIALDHDLAGISVRTRQLMYPQSVVQPEPRLDLATLDSLYDPADVNVLVFDPRFADRLVTYDQAAFGELVDAWQDAVRSHPAAYLAHRIAVLGTMFDLAAVHYPFHEGISPNDLGLRFVTTPLYETVIRLLHDSEWFFFRGWIFLLGALALAASGLRRRRWASTAIAMSGIAYVVPYAVISSGSDFRYIWWLVVATAIGVVVRLDELLAERFSATAPATVRLGEQP